MSQSEITDYFPRISDDGGGTLTFYLNWWVNNIEVNDEWRRRGYGRMLIGEAISRYGRIHFSTQTNDEDADDTRHLSTEGAALANHCVGAGMDVVLCHPNDFEEKSDSED
jgi:GNAT superfamily N-acetyltransferase